jgi:hypothetical protein
MMKYDQLLGEMSDALLRVQVDAAGKAGDMGYTPEEVAASRKVLVEFLEILARVAPRGADEKLPFPRAPKEQAAQEMVRSRRYGRDSLERIRDTIQHLQSHEPWETEDWDLLERVVNFLASNMTWVTTLYPKRRRRSRADRRPCKAREG